MQQNYEFTLDDHDLAITIGVEPLASVEGVERSPDEDSDYPADELAPPRREPTGRVQMSSRIRTDRMAALKRYQYQHGATLQAVVDQMIDEYLERRGLI